MRLGSDGTLLLSPSDLGNHLACEHLTQLELRVLRGELERPQLPDPYGDVVRAKGIEHERARLARLEEQGVRIARMPTYEDEAISSEERRRATEEAIRAGEADVIYQAYLSDGTWRGFADFLERQPDGTYEPVDTKLARSAKPLHLLQLCFYAEQLERIQGRLPERVHVELGTGERETFRTADFIAFYRRARERFLSALGMDGDPAARNETPPTTYPWPCEHCKVCDFRKVCGEQLRADDHLVLVAGLGRRYAEPLMAAGISTLEALGDAAPGTVVDGIRPETLEKLRHQASLQLHYRRTGEHRVEHLPDEPDTGFRLLPAPSEGDVWLDLEGHPFYEPARGLEYLLGWCYREDGEVRYEALWGTDRRGEKEAFERFVDWVEERRRRFPELHVYHYASYERTALRRLMGEHATREDEIDDWLRGELLVDLYRVVRQALRASVGSYSIKEVEKLYGFVRTAEVAGGDESVVLFERWLETGEDALLEGIRAYNEEDCRSLEQLHEWLLRQRPPELPLRPPPESRERSEAAVERDAERAALYEALLDGAA
ncbi:MAG: TM0106 family RecB-like putative nuclease, partial [Thermoleophilia bacterium]|nr:TM0106 family RecB-like putative nuclease [Thermoleophilia bacterium]